MSRKNLKRNFLVGISSISLATMLAFSFNVTSQACEVMPFEEVAESEGIQPRSPIIEWRFKIEDGKLYRRLYNYTDQCWVGEWELYT